MPETPIGSRKCVQILDRIGQGTIPAPILFVVQQLLPTADASFTVFSGLNWNFLQKKNGVDCYLDTSGPNTWCMGISKCN